MNRGMWIGLGLAIFYVTFRLAVSLPAPSGGQGITNALALATARGGLYETPVHRRLGGRIGRFRRRLRHYRCLGRRRATSRSKRESADFTPNLAPDSLISHPAAYALEQSPDGATMYVGGEFDALQDAALHAAITRPNFAAFSATTGAISATVAPTLARPSWRAGGRGGAPGGETAAAPSPSRSTRRTPNSGGSAPQT